MAKYTIYGVGHTESVPVIRYSGAPVYHGTYLKPSYLEFSSISSPALINWQIGDYIIYDRTGYTYRLYDIPQPTKKAVTIGGGEAYVYSNVQFYCATKELEICPFRDLVYKDSAYHFSTLNSVSTYENVAGIAGRIKANLANLYGNTWDVVVASGLSGFDETEAREFSTSGANCLEALDKIYEVWPGLGWVFSIVDGIYTITIGGANVRSSANTTNKYEYGRDKGLTMIKKTQANKDDFCTRLYVYGSSRNILSRYYNDLLDEDDQHIYQYGSVHVPNLMLPLTSWGKTDGKYDASKAYLENATAQAQYGLIPKTVYFDGTEDEEIFPSIKGTTIGNLRSAKSSTETGAPNYYPSTSVYTDADARLDEIVSAVSPSDDGNMGDSGSKYIEEASESVASSSSTLTVPASSAASINTVSVPNVLAHTFTQSGKATLSTECKFRITAPGSPTSVTAKCYIKNGGGVSVAVLDLDATETGGVYSFPLDFTAGNANQLMTGAVHLDIVFTVAYGALASAVTVTYGRTAATVSWGLSRVLTKTFSATIRQIGFDMMARAALSGNGNPSIAFTDGACAGRQFVVKSATYNSVGDNWNLVLYRGDDTSVSMRYPNTSYPVASGDHFVLLDIAMPDEYVGMAAQRLLAKGNALMQKNSKVEPFFEPSVNAKKVMENLAAHSGDEGYILREGKYMYISDSDIVGTDEYVIIDTLTINENEANIPTYKVTLRERKRQSFAQSIESSLSSLVSTSSGTSTASASGIGGAGGTGDYTELDNKPSIDGFILDGAMSAYDDLKLVTRDMFELDTESVAGTTLIKAKFGLYSEQQITAGGVGSGGGGGSAVSWNQIVSSGTKIATITINGTATDVYAPSGGGGSEPSAYIKSASVNGNTLTLTNKDDTTVEFTPSTDLSDYYTKSEVYTKAQVDALIPSLAGYLPLTAGSGKRLTGSLYVGTASTSLGIYVNNKAVAAQDWVEAKGYAVASDLATVATSGSYDDLSDKPTNLSDFTNDSGFITASSLNGYLPLTGGSLTGSLSVGGAMSVTGASTFTGNLLPASGASPTIGASSNRWSKVHASEVNFGGNSITIDDDTDILTVSGELTVASGLTAYALITEDDATVGGDLSVTGDASVGGNLSVTGHGDFGSGNGSYIKIGAIKIMYDSTNNALHLVNTVSGQVASFYTDGAITAGATN